MTKRIIAAFATFMPNILKIPLYRLAGYKIGKNVRVGFMTVILANEVKIEDNVRIGAMNVMKMNKLAIGEGSIVRSLNMMMGPKNLKLGKRTQIVGPHTFMNLAEDIELGDFCGLGSHSIFYTHGVYLPYTEGYPRKFGKIYLGKRVWSSSHIIYLPGSSVGDDSVVTPGSIVNGVFPENSLITGSPARRIADASKLKVKITPGEFNKRLKEIIAEFKRNSYLEDSETKIVDDKLIISQGKKKYLVEVFSGKKLENLDEYDEVIILGENLPESDNRKVSLFDFKKRKAVMKGKLSRIFLEHLGTFGENFYN